MAEKKVNIDPEVHRKLKIEASRRTITLKDFLTEIIDDFFEYNDIEVKE